MLAALPETRRRAVYGSPRPRLAPPRPLHSTRNELRAEAECLGIAFMPWQDEVALYLEATAASGNWLFAEVPVIVGRQNGKTEILVPHICRRLRMGRRLMHTAQNRELPREVFGRVAEHMLAKHAGELASKPRFANGQEEVRLRNGGVYRIVAPTRGGARGPSNDDLLIDEIREMEDHDFIAAAKPGLSARPNPQTLYLSNAGTEDSEVLNALRQRALSGEDPSLAYLEWSAAPERDAHDFAGWRESNPSIGHLPGKLDNLEREYRANTLGGTMDVFEVEYLCRWRTTLQRRLVTPEEWAGQEFGELGRPTRPVMAVKMDIEGTRASAVVAWLEHDGRVAVELAADVIGSPIDVNQLGPALVRKAAEYRAAMVGYDPYTDADLARHFRRAKAIVGRDYANASEGFARRAQARQFRVRDDAGTIGADLEWTARRAMTNAFIAVKANADHTNTAAEAAIRAAWLASEPIPIGRSEIH